MNRAQRRDWRTAVFKLGPKELTAAQKVVLLALETFADYPEGTNARPGVARLAGMCCLDERTARFALKAGQDLKLIEQTRRANPKRGLAAIYRLLPQPDSTGSGDPVEEISTGSGDPLDTPFNRIEAAFLPDRNAASTGSTDPPTNPLAPREGTKGGGSELRCARHRDDAHPPPCHDCKRVREQTTATFDAQRAAIRQAIDACDDCDEYGRDWFDSEVDCPRHLNFRQLRRDTA